MLPRIAIGLLVGAVVYFAVHRWRSRIRERRMKEARSTFFLRREWLEAHFLTLAGQSGLPRGLAWKNCEFDNAVQFAKDRSSGQLRALVAVTIRFEAIEGGGMEDVEAVSNLRAATAIFYYEQGQWKASSRALFNLNPREAMDRYRHELETAD